MGKKILNSFIHGGRRITPDEVEEIAETVEIFKNLSLTELAKTICEYLEWKSAGGGYKVDACIGLLERLEERGVLNLPEKASRSPQEKTEKPSSYSKITDPQPDIVGKLHDIRPVKLEIAVDGESKKLWNEYIDRYHYLGYKRPFGYRLRYFIKCNRGILGCILLAGPAKALTARDLWIGWTTKQRVNNLPWIVNNSRFLIFPWVKVKNLASHVLGKLSRRVTEDWEKYWGYRPVLMETFVDPEYYHGSCYKASNWKYLGMTTGEGLVRKGKSYSTTPKMIFVLPLTNDFREQLCSDNLEGRKEEEISPEDLLK